jgi:hypothetical protein
MNLRCSFCRPPASTALRVIMLINEKQLDVSLVNVDLGSEEKKAAYGAINPLIQVSVLGLDDGMTLAAILNARNSKLRGATASYGDFEWHSLHSR